MAPTGGTTGPGGRGRGQNPPLAVLVDGQQVAASNSTLNAWCRGRQPSWLANATPVQPTPRPPQPPSIPVPTRTAPLATASTQPQPQPQPQPQSQHLPPSPHPPQLQPQPQPRLQPQPPSRIRSPRQVPQARLQPASRPCPAVAALGDPRLSLHSADAIFPSPAPSDEPSPCLSIPHDSPNTRDLSPGDLSNDPLTTEAHFALDSHVSGHRSRPSQSRVPATPVNGLGASPSAEMALNTPPTPTVAGFSNTSAVPRELPQSIPAKRRRVANPASDFLDSLGALNKLDSYIRKTGGNLSLEETTERPRFILLKDACREGDIFFVALHQLFCAWTANPSSVHQLCDENVHDASLVDNAFGIMGTILKSNSKLRQVLLRWFADFPVYLHTLRLHSFYDHAITQVLDFLVCVSNKWVIVNYNHSHLGYPLLMSELLNDFHLYSPILQSIVFRASRRTLGVPDHPAGMQLDELFKADQERHRNPSDGTFSVPFEGKAYDEYNATLTLAYKSLVAQSKSSASNLPSSHGQSNPPALTTVHPPNFPSPAPVAHQIQPSLIRGFRPGSTPINTRRTASGNQSVHSPSPVHSPINPQNPAVVTNAIFTHQFAAAAPHVLPSSPSTGAVISPYSSPNITQQAQIGSSSFQVQQAIQQRQYEQQRRQQQQQIQIQQQFNYLLRKQSYPGTGSSPRPSPIQTTAPLPSQVQPTAQFSPQLQTVNGHSIPSAPPDNSIFFSGPTNSAYQLSSVDSQVPSWATNVLPVVPSLESQQPVVQLVDRLIPPPGLRINLQDYPHTPYEKRSIDHSLHQAHLRSPKRRHKLQSVTTPTERYYQAISGFALDPVPIPPQPFLYEFEFNVSDPVYERLSFDERIPGEVAPVNRFIDGSLRFRVRCCNLSAPMDCVPANVWVTSETAWSEHIFMSLNNYALGIKRKQHHSKDLPVEVSHYIKTGTNNLSIAIPVQSTQRRQQIPHIAVEIVEVLSHSTILRMVRESGHRRADETRKVIRNRLAGDLLDQVGEDDDLEIPVDGISIDLADPFTATIFNVPVRGNACTHLECFDLEIWLNTRLGKKSCTCGSNSDCKCPKEPSFVDKWRCPFCDGDARPYSLHIDDFLVDIRAQLEQKSLLRTKSITVYADGSWKPNESTECEDSDLDSDDGSTPIVPNIPSKLPISREVIELDDD
ncbi:hypothetical protein F5Y19DRAFT_284732 [Xylariaceae sp. FL1651]|nr:hypothetical protein F5Y19DRAFT_284732 [Xylariaceae sp. FL1651]